MKNRFFLIALAILLTGLFVTSSVRAGDDPEGQPPPPGQSAVGRLSVIHGQVSVMHGDAGEWVAATVNTPVVPGDRLTTGDRSRAEVQLDPANVIRLDQRAEAQVADLEQNKIQIQLASGLVDFTVLNGTQADVEVDTPNMGVHPLRPGVYRIQVNSASETLLIVRQGEAEVLTNQGTTKVEAGQVINIHGTDDPEYRIDPAPGGDDFDRWSSDRDRQFQNVQASQRSDPSMQHMDPSVVGSSDLDAYGQWSEVPDEGWCWTPQVDIGWTPYAIGRWGYEPYWGWTWISGEPWGWAPYHYGNWFMFGGHWHWRPDGGRGGFRGGNRWGGGGRFLPGGGPVNGRAHIYTPGSGGRSNFVGTSRMGGAQFGARGSVNSWQGFSRGNQSARSFNGGGTGWQGRNAPAVQGRQNNWGRFASPSPYSGGRQGYNSAPRSYSGGGYAGRSGGSSYGGGSRPPLQLNRPIMRQRAPNSGYYGGGGRTYSAPSGGNRGYSAPGGGGRSYSAPSGGGRTYSAPRGGSSGGGHSYSAPRGGGGGGGGHSSGGGGSHGGGRH